MMIRGTNPRVLLKKRELVGEYDPFHALGLDKPAQSGTGWGMTVPTRSPAFQGPTGDYEGERPKVDIFNDIYKKDSRNRPMR